MTHSDVSNAVKEVARHAYDPCILDLEAEKIHNYLKGVGYHGIISFRVYCASYRPSLIRLTPPTRMIDCPFLAVQIRTAVNPSHNFPERGMINLANNLMHLTLSEHVNACDNFVLDVVIRANIVLYTWNEDCSTLIYGPRISPLSRKGAL